MQESAMLRAKVTELSFSAWDAGLLPSNFTRIFQESIAGNVTVVLLLAGIAGPHPSAPFDVQNAGAFSQSCGSVIQGRGGDQPCCQRIELLVHATFHGSGSHVRTSL